MVERPMNDLDIWSSDKWLFIVVPQALPNCPYRPEQMYMDGVRRESRCFCDLDDIHVLNKPEKENCPLSLGQNLGCVPDGPHLLIDRSSFFGRQTPVGQPIANRIAIDGSAVSLLPELQSTVSRKVSNEIHCDSHQPRVYAGLAAKRLAT